MYPLTRQRRGWENRAWSVPESDSPDKPDTPPSRLSLDQLRAEIDAAVGSLPTIPRCTVDALTERVAPVFKTPITRCVKKPKINRLADATRGRDAETRQLAATLGGVARGARRVAVATRGGPRGVPRGCLGAGTAHPSRGRAARGRGWAPRSPRLWASASRRAAPAAACSPRRRCGGTRRLSARVAAALGERGVAARLRDVKSALGG